MLHHSWDAACEMIYAAYRHAVALNAEISEARAPSARIPRATPSRVSTDA
jgi:hypothetical protein